MPDNTVFNFDYEGKIGTGRWLDEMKTSQNTYEYQKHVLNEWAYTTATTAIDTTTTEEQFYRQLGTATYTYTTPTIWFDDFTTIVKTEEENERPAWETL